MFERTFTVRYITLKKCFCYVSDKHARLLEQGSALRCTYGNNSCYFTVGQYLPKLKETEIGISGAYAKILGFKENEPINVSLCGNMPGIKTVNVTPSNNDDYEILELMAESVQSTLLDQIRVVHNGQKIVIWISNSLHTVVDIDGVQPVSPGLLGQLTEVVIKPPVIPEKQKKKRGSHIWSINGFLKYFMSNKPIEKECVLNKYKDLCVPFVFRIHPIQNLRKSTSGNVFDVFVPKKILPKNVIDSKSHLLFSLNPIIEPKDINYFEETKSEKSVVVRLRILEDEDAEIKTGTKYFLPLFVNDQILVHYNLNIGSKVILNYVQKLQDVSKVEICTNRSNFRTVKDAFKLYVAENTKDSKQLLLNADFLMDVSDSARVLLKFTPAVPSCLVDGDFIRNGQLSVNELEIGEKKLKTLEDYEEICLDCTNFEDIINGCIQCLGLGFGDKRSLENILITGSSGSGKSTLARAFTNSVQIAPKYIHVETIHCKNIKGKSLDSMHKYFTTTFLKLIYYQPSILILDDLHVICEKVADGDQPTQESLLLNKTSEMLADLLAHYVRNNFIQIVATSESTMKLNQHIFASRGVHLFKNIFSIGDFDKNDRTKFMRFAFSKRALLDDVDLEDLSSKTEGFVAQDLVDFVDKCVFESYKDDVTVVNSNHCKNALNASSSLSLRNVQLHSAGDRDFSDVGGLEDVKKILVESMLWPAQYANIFGKAPLRLQSGLLLYGPPGTGKTILAGAAAKQCNLRLISIKGPELLSKYIGASEQAVRDVFHKAQSAKPCILFFDEFDSLAPRRGHDNTGVTDRVVNQFLTQLDGVEALTGVCVLAATSRPDLLDPALLRPGRLDRQLLCPLPDADARLAILRALSRTLSFAEGVDLGAIAAATEGYTGADLQGVLYTAQLTSVEHLLNVDEMGPDELKEQDAETEITQQHLNEGLRTTRPSLTSSERLKYDRIYAKFEGKGDLMDLKAGKQRATLA